MGPAHKQLSLCTVILPAFVQWNPSLPHFVAHSWLLHPTGNLFNKTLVKAAWGRKGALSFRFASVLAAEADHIAKRTHSGCKS